MADHARIEIEGLVSFRAALRKAQDDAPKQMNAKIKTLMGPLASHAASLAPRRTGELASSGRPFTSGKIAGIQFSAAHAPVLEFAHKGRYASLSPRWGPPARFAYKALDDEESRIRQEILATIEDVCKAQGWLDN